MGDPMGRFRGPMRRTSLDHAYDLDLSAGVDFRLGDDGDTEPDPIDDRTDVDATLLAGHSCRRSSD